MTSAELAYSPSSDDDSNGRDSSHFYPDSTYVNRSSPSSRREKRALAAAGLSTHRRSSNGSGHRKSSVSKRELARQTLDEGELQDLRLKVNSRERKRMHDLNSALDSLREVMPYAHGPSVRKLSKIATLLLAKNYILMLNSSLEEMRKLLPECYRNTVGIVPHPGIPTAASHTHARRG